MKYIRKEHTIMTKTMKKFISLFLSAVMVLALGITVMAADPDPYTITINKVSDNDKSAHSYEVYQIFDAEVENDKLYDFKWGSGVDGDAALTELKKLEDFKDCTSLPDVLAVLEAQADNSAVVDAFATAVSKHLTSTKKEGAMAATETTTNIGVEKTGYYLVKDTITGGANGQEGAVSKFMLDVVKATTAVSVNTKAVVPELDKKIVSGSTRDVKNQASVGDAITFELTSEVPDLTNSGYNKYCFVMNDTLSAGLSYIGDAAPTVTIGSTTLTENTDFTFEKTTATDGKTTLKIVFKDMLTKAQTMAGQKITVTYQAKLNEKAVVTDAGNPNTANLIYSNDPSHEYTSDEPGNGDPAGKTPDKETITYTTGVSVIKVDENDQKLRLAGAEFKIEGTSSAQVISKTNEFTPDASGTYYKLKTGEYTEEAPSTDTEDKYASKTDKYKLVENTTLVEDSESVVKSAVGTDGELTFNGLGAGTYTITETKAPDGYVLDPTPRTVEITCTFDSNNKPSWSYKLDSNAAVPNQLQFKVTNKKTSDLPKTGGIGTTIFYAGGAVLVLGGIVLLVLKKKGSEKE